MSGIYTIYALARLSYVQHSRLPSQISSVVYFGDLGNCSCNLVSYFEDLGSSPLNKGENPATWMLNVLGESIVSGDEPLDFARAWEQSSNYAELQRKLCSDETKEGAGDTRDETLKITYDSEFASSWWEMDT